MTMRYVQYTASPHALNLVGTSTPLLPKPLHGGDCGITSSSSSLPLPWIASGLPGAYDGEPPGLPGTYVGELAPGLPGTYVGELAPGLPGAYVGELAPGLPGRYVGESAPGW
jgi:hypothetical protein